MFSTPIRWGIAATGAIANDFVSDLTRVDDAIAVAVCSRNPARAAEFAARHGIARHYGSYEALAADPEIDIVYVATPPSRHMADTVMFLEAGKHVLCEKPFAINAAQARVMTQTAARCNRFLMEAMWARFLPPYVQLRTLLDERRIGEVLAAESSFGVRFPDGHRLFDWSIGGGSLLDLGIYPVHFSSFVLGTPDSIHATGHLGPTGVDENVAAAMRFAGGVTAVAQCSIRATLTSEATITGAEGQIRLPQFMHCPRWLDVAWANGHERIETAWDGNGLRFQVAHVHDCLRNNLLDSPTMPGAESITMMETLDTIRGQIGLRYADDD